MFCYLIKGGAHCLAWSRTQDHTFALTCNNDVKIYDIRVKLDLG